MKSSEEQFNDEAKRSFDASVDALDAATLSKLNRSRQAALAAASGPRRSLGWWLMPVGGTAAAMLAVLLLRTPAVTLEETPADIDILLAEESIEMFEELEFYSWLDAADLDVDGDTG